MCSLVVNVLVKEHPPLIYFASSCLCETGLLYYSFISMSMNVFLNLTPSGTIQQAMPSGRLGD
jgi:hypothetical protein